jgi:hypothetical protein
MNHTFHFGGLDVSAPEPWEDVSTEGSAVRWPPTLARSDGGGALQFTLAPDAGSMAPSVTFEGLAQRVRELAARKRLGEPVNGVRPLPGALLGAAADFHGAGYSVRVWYVSDGRNVAQATYTWEGPPPVDELEEAERIVRSARFPPLER